MPTLTLANLSKTYPNGHQALRGVTVTVGDGEFMVLVGPSGCGKSTMLRLIAGLDTPSQGSIAIDARAVDDLAPHDRDIAMVFQNFALYPHLSVRRNLSLPLELRGLAREEISRRVRETAALLDVEALLDRKPGQLSGGQRQRVALGRAMVREPKVLLFDEPLSNLDASLRASMRVEIKALHRRLRTTTVYVTHDQEEAMTLGERVMLLRAGVVQQCDSPLNVYRAPANRFVAGFIGHPRMNFVEGSLVGEGASRRFVGTLPTGAPCEMVIHPAHLPRLAGHHRVVLGLRPTSFELAPQAGAWRIPVTVVEVLGETMDVYSGSGPEALVVRLCTRGVPPPNGVVELSPRASEAAWFAPGDEGLALLPPT